jgi:hypothetical protein
MGEVAGFRMRESDTARDRSDGRGRNARPLLIALVCALGVRAILACGDGQDRSEEDESELVGDELTVEDSPWRVQSIRLRIIRLSA